MPSVTHARLNNLFMQIPKRSEGVDRQILVRTFVDLDPLMTLISTRDHQVIYGRRGTGKTHALLYLSEANIRAGQLSVYIDMRTIGSSGGIYSDPSIAIAERGTRLLMDTMGAVHESLFAQIIEHSDSFDLSTLGPQLDTLATAITEVRVTGNVEVSESRKQSQQTASKDEMKLGIGGKGPNASLGSSDARQASDELGITTLRRGTLEHRVHFGALVNALTHITRELGKRRIWLILDEWSAVPIELQPLLADLVRRSILPVPGVTVKIGAIEHRSLFQVAEQNGDYIGIELGADVSADVNLDDFMVFDNSADRAKQFFAQLLHKHCVAISNEDGTPLPDITPEQLVSNAFFRRDVYEEYVRASEGVPRDAINILSLAARQAMTTGIAMENVRVAARLWYERDKQAAVDSNPEARNLLFSIIDEVIKKRRTRAFLIKSNTRDRLVDDLFDKRVLHILKRNVSSNDQPGIRYDVFKIDYGCYVDLLSSAAKAPLGLLPAGEDNSGAYVDVPPDDYRSIRRAILDIDVLAQRRLLAP